MFEISMYHQMHCLMGYRQYLQKMLAGEDIDAQGYRHSDHCSSYLTQLMLCGGDTTLEPTETAVNRRSGRKVHVVTFEGVLHQCRDWTQVGDWVEDHFNRWEAEQKHYKGENLN
ncbi:hypothetical protein BDQ17DRAFT_1282295 [Cyathus striatus]|nr:hypothetical protein BDQ17DRAFT_1282295 [Cyathus striatus]